ncbi:8574_t:CDS:2 [Cetraspora pellucida]|uniref:8574_t:CDS:1 n=1 Tax=Cetraspora pellucida TaxID=1433469 RepID=A0A9N8W300_9GLOM|nr:8574_t:CDS:2 [Cetraspora pellucida]
MLSDKVLLNANDCRINEPTDLNPISDAFVLKFATYKFCVMIINH